MGWKKLLLFLLIFPIAVTFFGGILLCLPSIIAKVSLPNDLYMQVKPLLQ